MRKLRVLIVDESAVIRRLLSDALSTDPAIKVAGTAATGRIALAKIQQINPDLITLDPGLPDMEWLSTLSELRKTHPHVPLIMFSARAQRGVAPVQASGVAVLTERVRTELIPKIKTLCGFADSPPSLPAAKRTADSRALSASRNVPVEIVAIGVSTGGPNALAEIFRELPGNFPAPIVVVQHMPPMFTKQLAERLDSTSPLEVREAKEGEIIGPGQAWVAPGNFHMELFSAVAGVMIRLHQGPQENSCRPAADVLFRSVAEIYGPAAVAVVLTGMGQDGLRGCEAIRDVGGWVIAQDKATSVVWGMPGAVVATGLADQTLPLPQIARELSHLVHLDDEKPKLALASPEKP